MGIFPDEPALAVGFIGDEDNGDGGDSWRCAKLQSNDHNHRCKKNVPEKNKTTLKNVKKRDQNKKKRL